MELFAYHNSREKYCRLPQGALCCREKAVLRIKLWGADAHNASVKARLWVDNREDLIESRRFNDGFDTVHEFEIEAPEQPQLIWYYFIIDACGERLFYGARTGVGKLTDTPPEDYQITVYDGAFETPAWFRRGTVYQIFPDRFHRGGKDGKGKTALDRLEYHENMGRRVVRHEKWDEASLYKPLKGEKHYSPCDYFGGDLRGIREKLPYLARLGISCIYLNPIFEAASNHRYNTSDYMSVDPVLGDERELKKLCVEAKKLGMRIMLDGVFSHTGDDSVYFNKYGNYDSVGAYSSKNSPYYEWYHFDRFPNKYRCWWGFKTLPEVVEDNPSYREFVCKVLEKWAKCGATSWRLDVADELPESFIEMLRKKLKRLDGEGVLLGEVWEDASNKLWEKGLRRYVYGQELDSVMNYPFRDALVDFFVGRIDAYELNEALSSQRERYPEPFYRACMNILGSHDSERILSALSGAPGRGELSRDQQAKYTPDEEALCIGRKRLMSAAALQYAMPQPPCIYYGDEAGMVGLFDPFNRETFPWGREDAELLERYRLLGKLRSVKSALNSGKTAFTAFSQDVFAVLRADEGGSVIVLVNRSCDNKTLSVRECDFYEGPDAGDMPFADKYVDLLCGKLHRKNPETGGIVLKLDGFGACILLGGAKRGSIEEKH